MERQSRHSQLLTTLVTVCRWRRQHDERRQWCVLALRGSQRFPLFCYRSCYVCGTCVLNVLCVATGNMMNGGDQNMMNGGDQNMNMMNGDNQNMMGNDNQNMMGNDNQNMMNGEKQNMMGRNLRRGDGTVVTVNSSRSYLFVHSRSLVRCSTSIPRCTKDVLREQVLRR